MAGRLTSAGLSRLGSNHSARRRRRRHETVHLAIPDSMGDVNKPSGTLGMDSGMTEFRVLVDYFGKRANSELLGVVI